MGYQEIKGHSEHHHKFLARLSELDAADPCSEQCYDKVAQIMIKFVATHYDAFDKPLADFLRAHRVEAIQYDVSVNDELKDILCSVLASINN